MIYKKRKILYISGSRAEYGLMKETLLAIKRQPGLELEIVATGMHLMQEFGETVSEIIKDNFKIHRIEAVYEGDDKESMANFIGDFITKFIKLVKKIKPDMIFVQGDRSEMLGAAIVGAYLAIPVVHTHGGDVTSTVDEFARHAITKLSHIHFAATKKSAERIIKMGEESWRVFVVGAPGFGSIYNEKLLSKDELGKKYDLDFTKPILLVLQHPLTTEVEEAAAQIKQTMDAIKELKFQSIVIYPNADAGGREMIKVIEKYKKYPFIRVYKSLPSLDYLSLLKSITVMAGNSSSGIIESSPFKLPVVNIGERQDRRERSCNVLDVDYSKERIRKAIYKAIYDKEFRKKVKNCKNPYGDGKAGQRITDVLSKIKIDKKLLQKQISY
jgi:GDP/UDP-N,N'-diacetylbacillosamine 2-epimerase (hydrolysing)